MRCNSLLGFGLLSLGLLACRSDGGGGTTGDDDDTHPDTPAKTKIQDVQNDAMPPGTAVSLSGVIVTAIDAFGPKTGDFWVQEPEGGAFSGIHVFGAAASDIAMLKVGDIVSITGAVKDEFALTSDTSGRTTTELENPQGSKMVVTKTGNGAAPAPEVVDILAIGKLATQAERDAEWEKWEGVLITTSNIAAFGTPQCIKSMGVCGDPTFASFNITGVAKAESQLTAFPASVQLGTCFSKMTGVVDYFFDYLIFPRDATEMTIAADSSACTFENTAAQCDDGLDNDGNGFKDCEDNSCVVAFAGCRSVTTISAINTTLPTGPVELDDVFITAISQRKDAQGNVTNGTDYWVSTNLAAGPKDGIYVFTGAPLPTGATIGAKVTLIGSVSAFDNAGKSPESVNEFAPLSAVVTAAPGGTLPSASAQTAANLVVDATGRPFVGSLVTLTNVTVTTKADNFGVAKLTQAATTFAADDDIVKIPDGDVGKCYASITGVWTYLPFNSAYGFIPLAPLPTATATCP